MSLLQIALPPTLKGISKSDARNAVSAYASLCAGKYELDASSLFKVIGGVQSAFMLPTKSGGNYNGISYNDLCALMYYLHVNKTLKNVPNWFGQVYNQNTNYGKAVKNAAAFIAGKLGLKIEPVRSFIRYIAVHDKSAKLIKYLSGGSVSWLSLWGDDVKASAASKAKAVARSAVETEAVVNPFSTIDNKFNWTPIIILSLIGGGFLFFKLKGKKQ